MPTPNQLSWQRKQNAAKNLALEKLALYKNDPFFNLGLGLYWGEGRKTNMVGLANLDLRVLKTFINWTKAYLEASEFSGALWVADLAQFPNACHIVEQELGINIKWQQARTDKRHCKINKSFGVRPFGVVEINVLNIPLAITTVNTWIAHGV